MEKYVVLDDHGTVVYTVKNQNDRYLFKYVRDCTYEEDVIKHHQFNKIVGGGYFVWRVGYYKIIRIFDLEIYRIGNEMVADVEYKENFNDQFVVIPEPMRMRPLFNKVSFCDEKPFYKSNPFKLLDKEIQIHSCELVDTEFQGEASKSYKVNWSVVQ